MQLPRTIVVPIDFSDSSEHALDYAVALAAKLDARIHAVHVVSPVITSTALYADAMASVLDGSHEALEKLVAARRDKAAFGPIRVEVGDPRDIIDATAASLSAELIVMGTRGRRGVTRVLLGSVAESVARTAPCPVLLVRKDQ